MTRKNGGVFIILPVFHKAEYFLRWQKPLFRIRRKYLTRQRIYYIIYCVVVCIRRA